MGVFVIQTGWGIWWKVIGKRPWHLKYIIDLLESKAKVMPYHL